MFSTKTLRPFLYSAAALALTGAVLSGCSDEEAKAPAAPQSETATATTSTPAAETAKPVTSETTAAVADIPDSEGSVDVAKLLEPGALPDKQLGSDDAPVTIVEYASATCGHCANFHAGTLPAIKEKYVDTGKARIIFREFPFDPLAMGAFMLARCSDDNYFPMIDVLFKQQNTWARAEKPSEELLKIARLAGFTQERFEACLTDDALLKDVTSVKERGEKEFGVNATPTFFINGEKYSGNMSVEVMSAIIDRALQ